MAKMTEKQFRKALILSGMVSSSEYTPLLDRVVIVAREAGLEFAPEPVKLPERLSTSIVRPVSLVPALDCEPWSTEEVRRLSYEQAAARHNGYPGLREKAENLVTAIEHRFNSLSQGYIRQELMQIKNELAKGPK